MKEQKILVAEDDGASANLLRKILVKDGYFVETTSNGLEAYEELQKNSYDLLLTDWMMPQMDGIELIRKVRRNINPAPIIVVVTALTSPEARNHALESGADDFITKPYKLTDILKKINDLFLRLYQEPPVLTEVPHLAPERPAPFPAICIAASSGGPQTLYKLFGSMTSIENAAIFVVQHGPSWALQDMAANWERMIGMNVSLGVNGRKIESNNLYLAPGGLHMTVNPASFEIKLEDGPPENYVKPAADPLLRSVAKTFGRKSIAVVLTGMGYDGTNGAKYIKEAGGTVIAQDPETAIVKTMPSSVIKAVPDSIILALEEIPGKLVKLVSAQKVESRT